MEGFNVLFGPVPDYLAVLAFFFSAPLTILVALYCLFSFPMSSCRMDHGNCISLRRANLKNILWLSAPHENLTVSLASEQSKEEIK